ncbi:pectate lyase [Sandaracinobacter neustonicus]|uniref:Pectate lyase n=1 Tax=Sandaracinobacter neustonicus TaxID=1715348 RepID=A0A501XK05_9SPHN|nr:pectate lyase [Sandaracinobacter neustonicus]TPE60604.1 pectate lyase [Sandaracinobacter neustonicus]
MRRALAAALLLVLPGVAAAATPPLAFPGAEGAGRFAAGGRGGAVLRVTNLADSGPGSLRAAIETKGARIILFEVAGTIRLTSDLVVREPRLTIAGQSAPGGGVTLADHGLVIRADDVVVRYIRVRRGDMGGEGDAIWIAGGARIILDHVTASWSTDETLSVSGERDGEGPRDVTVQWSVIADSLRRSVHAKGEHGYGSLVRGSRGAHYSFHHNLWANHQARMPRPGNYLPPAEDVEGPVMEFRSNLFHNWGGKAAGYNSDAGSLARYSFIDNAYSPGPDSKGRLAFREENPAARSWFSGNSMAGVVPGDPWSLVEGADRPGIRLEAPVSAGAVQPDPPARAAERILAKAGASCPRDAVDLALVADVGAGRGRLIDSQQQAGGWPELAAGRPVAPGADIERWLNERAAAC